MSPDPQASSQSNAHGATGDRQANNDRISQNGDRGQPPSQPTPPVPAQDKRPALWLAFVLLLMLPGLNLVYAGIWRRGWIVLGLSILGYALQIAISLVWAPQSYWQLMTGLGGLIGLHALLFIWALIDNLLSQFQWRRRGFLPSPRRLGPWLAFGLGALVMTANGFAIATSFEMDSARSLHPFSIPSGSMQPGLQVGDMFIAVRPTTRPLTRGDILVFKPGQASDAPYYVKRLIGLPGDRIALENHRAIINGEPERWRSRDARDPGAVRACIDQRCYDLLIDNPSRGGSGADMSERHLAADEYFFLGDHRDQSLDSRFASMGTIARARIYYRGYQIYWPLTHWRGLLF